MPYGLRVFAARPRRPSRNRSLFFWDRDLRFSTGSLPRGLLSPAEQTLWPNSTTCLRFWDWIMRLWKGWFHWPRRALQKLPYLIR